MAVNQSGVAITIKAFLPTGKTLDEQFLALSLVKDATESGNYDLLLAASSDVSIKTEAKTRRLEVPVAPAAETVAEPAAWSLRTQPVADPVADPAWAEPAVERFTGWDD
jgi:hypothetical protein